MSLERDSVIRSGVNHIALPGNRAVFCYLASDLNMSHLDCGVRWKLWLTGLSLRNGKLAMLDHTIFFNGLLGAAKKKKDCHKPEQTDWTIRILLLVSPSTIGGIGKKPSSQSCNIV